MKNYEVGKFDFVVETGLTREQARKMVRDAWKKNQTVLYWRETGTTEWYM